MVSCLGNTDYHFKNCLLSSSSVTPLRLSVWEKRVWEIQLETENHVVRAFFIGFPFIPTPPAQCNFLPFFSSCSFTLWKWHRCVKHCQTLMNVVHLSQSSYSNVQILKIILKRRLFITHISSDVASGRRRNNNNNNNNSMTKHSIFLRSLG